MAAEMTERNLDADVGLLTTVTSYVPVAAYVLLTVLSGARLWVHRLRGCTLHHLTSAKFAFHFFLFFFAVGRTAASALSLTAEGSGLPGLVLNSISGCSYISLLLFLEMHWRDILRPLNSTKTRKVAATWAVFLTLNVLLYGMVGFVVWYEWSQNGGQVGSMYWSADVIDALLFAISVSYTASAFNMYFKLNKSMAAGNAAAGVDASGAPLPLPRRKLSFFNRGLSHTHTHAHTHGTAQPSHAINDAPDRRGSRGWSFTEPTGGAGGGAAGGRLPEPYGERSPLVARTGGRRSTSVSSRLLIDASESGGGASPADAGAGAGAGGGPGTASVPQTPSLMRAPSLRLGLATVIKGPPALALGNTRHMSSTAADVAEAIQYHSDGAGRGAGERGSVAGSGHGISAAAAAANAEGNRQLRDALAVFISIMLSSAFLISVRAVISLLVSANAQGYWWWQLFVVWLPDVPPCCAYMVLMWPRDDDQRLAASSKTKLGQLFTRLLSEDELAEGSSWYGNKNAELLKLTAAAGGKGAAKGYRDDDEDGNDGEGRDGAGRLGYQAPQLRLGNTVSNAFSNSAAAATATALGFLASSGRAATNAASAIAAAAVSPTRRTSSGKGIPRSRSGASLHGEDGQQQQQQEDESGIELSAASSTTSSHSHSMLAGTAAAGPSAQPGADVDALLSGATSSSVSAAASTAGRTWAGAGADAAAAAAAAQQAPPAIAASPTSPPPPQQVQLPLELLARLSTLRYRLNTAEAKPIPADHFTSLKASVLSFACVAVRLPPKMVTLMPQLLQQQQQAAAAMQQVGSGAYGKGSGTGTVVGRELGSPDRSAVSLSAARSPLQAISTRAGVDGGASVSGSGSSDDSGVDDSSDEDSGAQRKQQGGGSRRRRGHGHGHGHGDAEEGGEEEELDDESPTHPLIIRADKRVGRRGGGPVDTGTPLIVNKYSKRRGAGAAAATAGGSGGAAAGPLPPFHTSSFYVASSLIHVPEGDGGASFAPGSIIDVDGGGVAGSAGPGASSIPYSLPSSLMLNAASKNKRHTVRSRVLRLAVDGSDGGRPSHAHVGAVATSLSSNSNGTTSRFTSPLLPPAAASVAAPQSPLSSFALDAAAATRRRRGSDSAIDVREVGDKARRNSTSGSGAVVPALRLNLHHEQAEEEESSGNAAAIVPAGPGGVEDRQARWVTSPQRGRSARGGALRYGGSGPAPTTASSSTANASTRMLLAPQITPQLTAAVNARLAQYRPWLDFECYVVVCVGIRVRSQAAAATVTARMGGAGGMMTTSGSSSGLGPSSSPNAGGSNLPPGGALPLVRQRSRSFDDMQLGPGPQGWLAGVTAVEAHEHHHHHHHSHHSHADMHPSHSTGAFSAATDGSAGGASAVATPGAGGAGGGGAGGEEAEAVCVWRYIGHTEPAYLEETGTVVHEYQLPGGGPKSAGPTPGAGMGHGLPSAATISGAAGPTPGAAAAAATAGGTPTGGSLVLEPHLLCGVSFGMSVVVPHKLLHDAQEAALMLQQAAETEAAEAARSAARQPGAAPVPLPPQFDAVVRFQLRWYDGEDEDRQMRTGRATRSSTSGTGSGTHKSRQQRAYSKVRSRSNSLESPVAPVRNAMAGEAAAASAAANAASRRATRVSFAAGGGAGAGGGGSIADALAGMGAFDDDRDDAASVASLASDDESVASLQDAAAVAADDSQYLIASWVTPVTAVLSRGRPGQIRLSCSAADGNDAIPVPDPDAPGASEQLDVLSVGVERVVNVKPGADLLVQGLEQLMGGDEEDDAEDPDSYVGMEGRLDEEDEEYGEAAYEDEEAVAAAEEEAELQAMLGRGRAGSSGSGGGTGGAQAAGALALATATSVSAPPASDRKLDAAAYCYPVGLNVIAAHRERSVLSSHGFLTHTGSSSGNMGSGSGSGAATGAATNTITPSAVFPAPSAVLISGAAAPTGPPPPLAVQHHHPPLMTSFSAQVRISLTEVTAESAYAAVVPRVLLPLILSRRLQQLEAARLALERYLRAMEEREDRDDAAADHHQLRSVQVVPDSTPQQQPSYGAGGRVKARPVTESSLGRVKSLTGAPAAATPAAAKPSGLASVYGRIVGYIESEEEKKAGAQWLCHRLIRLHAYCSELSSILVIVSGCRIRDTSKSGGLPGVDLVVARSLLAAAVQYAGPIKPIKTASSGGKEKEKEKDRDRDRDRERRRRGSTSSDPGHSPRLPITDDDFMGFHTPEPVVTFRSSALKADSSTRFMPLNLHVQLMSLSAALTDASGGEAQRVPPLQLAAANASIVTVGAPAAHHYHFKGGVGLGIGIRKLLSLRSSPTLSSGRELAVNALMREIEDSRLALRFRSDVVVTQAASAIVACFANALQSAFDQALSSDVSRLLLALNAAGCPSTSPAATGKWLLRRRWLQLAHEENEGVQALRQWLAIGWLAVWESLLSCYGKERGMLDDARFAVAALSLVRFVIVDAQDAGAILPEGVDAHGGEHKGNNGGAGAASRARTPVPATPVTPATAGSSGTGGGGGGGGGDAGSTVSKSTLDPDDDGVHADKLSDGLEPHIEDDQEDESPFAAYCSGDETPAGNTPGATARANNNPASPGLRSNGTSKGDAGKKRPRVVVLGHHLRAVPAYAFGDILSIAAPAARVPAASPGHGGTASSSGSGSGTSPGTGAAYVSPAQAELNDTGLVFVLPVKGLRAAVTAGVLPAELLPHPAPAAEQPVLPIIRCCPVLVTQGINEMQQAAAFIGNTSLQRDINNDTVRVLQQHVRAFVGHVSSETLRLQTAAAALAAQLHDAATGPVGAAAAVSAVASSEDSFRGSLLRLDDVSGQLWPVYISSVTTAGAGKGGAAGARGKKAAASRAKSRLMSSAPPTADGEGMKGDEPAAWRLLDWWQAPKALTSAASSAAAAAAAAEGGGRQGGMPAARSYASPRSSGQHGRAFASPASAASSTVTAEDGPASGTASASASVRSSTPGGSTLKSTDSMDSITTAFGIHEELLWLMRAIIQARSSAGAADALLRFSADSQHHTSERRNVEQQVQLPVAPPQLLPQTDRAQLAGALLSRLRAQVAGTAASEAGYHKSSSGGGSSSRPFGSSIASSSPPPMPSPRGGSSSSSGSGMAGSLPPVTPMLRALTEAVASGAPRSPSEGGILMPSKPGTPMSPSPELSAAMGRVSATGGGGVGGGTGSGTPVASTSSSSSSVEESPQAAFLRLAEDLCRALRGGRLTSCKSAKDRTGMSVTLEESRFAAQFEAGVVSGAAAVLSQLSALPPPQVTTALATTTLAAPLSALPADVAATAVLQVQYPLYDVHSKWQASFQRMRAAWALSTTGSSGATVNADLVKAVATPPLLVMHMIPAVAAFLQHPYVAAVAGRTRTVGSSAASSGSSSGATVAAALAAAAHLAAAGVPLTALIAQPDDAVCSDVLGMANFMREYGTRLSNAEKNTGTYKFAFNAFQRAFFPVEYRAPLSVIGGHAT